MGGKILAPCAMSHDYVILQREAAAKKQMGGEN